jgi:hypothetical protein
VIVVALLATSAHAAVLFETHGILAASGINVQSQPSWLEGGWGRLQAGASLSDDRRNMALGFAHIGADAFFTNWFSLHANGVARAEPSRYGGRTTGLVEAYADITPLDTEHDRLRLRAGMFFLPTSRENVGPLWSSPYTITFSAWNSWIGEEFRPIGAEFEYRHDHLTFGAGAFVGNDTSGTLIAWRGWAMHSRLTTYNEVLPLPPLYSLSDPDAFGGKQRDGTKPFGSDLDGRTGWTGRVRYTQPQRFTIQLTAVDNRGDQKLYHGEYAWYTDFLLLGADWHPTDHTTFAAEVANGETAMGYPATKVEMFFRTAYLLASQEFGQNRISARIERFHNTEGDYFAEDNSEEGNALTLAYFFTPREHLRLGLELVKVNAQKPAAAQSGSDPDTNGRTITAEARWAW